MRDDLFPGLGDFQGTLDVTSTTSLAAVTVRRNSAAPAWSIVPAVPALARRIRFFLPQILDGPATAATLQTTFLLTNLSTKPANVTLSLTQSDGTPLVLSIPGLDDNSDFAAAIPPGASVFWQSDGSSPALSTGVAVIRSDQPLSASAVITSSDGQGTFFSESGVSPAPVDFQFVIPFDGASNTIAGAAFFNAGAQTFTLTLNLIDPDGKPLGSATLDPLAPGARVTGMLTDFFPGSTVASGSIVASTGSPIGASLAAASLRDTVTGDAFSAAPAFRLPVNPTRAPAAVVTRLDAAHAVTATVPISGGTLVLTDAKGNRFTLTIPSGALLGSETITMTSIASATGISGPGLVAGVQLEPEGLGLLRPALLKIELASAPPAGVFPIGWRGQAPGVYLNPPLPDPKSFTLMLTHFSGAGAGGFDLTSELINIIDHNDFYQSMAAEAIARGRQAALSGDDQTSQEVNQELTDLIQQWYDDVLGPLLELAQASDDEDVMRCAATIALGYSRQVQLMGLDDAPEVPIVDDALAYMMSRAAQKLIQRCQQHDFTVYFEILGLLRQSALMGLPDPGVDPSACPPALQLTFKSEIFGVIPVGLTGTFDATINAKINLTGSFTKDVLTEVTDPAKDLLTSFTLSGSGVETYDTLLLTVNNVPAGCSVTVGSKTPDTLTVKQGADPQLSQVQFKFNPNYQPQALTINQQQLCSFCPVYRKTPIKTELWIDPGKPSETFISTCKGGSATVPGNFWYAGWSVNHATAGDNGFITGWDLQSDPTFQAQKNINKSVTGPSATLSEKTTLMLKPMGQ